MTENVVWELDLGGAQGRRDFVSAHYASNTCWKSCKTIVDNDVPLLIARVRELQAQAAREAAVVEAAKKRADAEDALSVIDNSDRVFKPEWTQARRDVTAASDELDAALAAREAQS